MIKRKMLILLQIILFAGLVSCGVAENEMVSQKIAVLHKAKKYDEAFKLANEALNDTNNSNKKDIAKIKMQLGGMYQFGYGTKKDLNLAVKYYTEASDEGDAYAQLLLGMMYLNGDGVSQDLEKAKLLLNKSADQGNERAKRILNDLK